MVFISEIKLKIKIIVAYHGKRVNFYVFRPYVAFDIRIRNTSKSQTITFCKWINPNNFLLITKKKWDLVGFITTWVSTYFYNCFSSMISPCELLITPYLT